MGYGARDPYSDYMSGNTYGGGAPAPQAPAGGMMGALPFVQAGLSGVGLLSSLYGNYEANKIARKNYELQKQEFEYERQTGEDERKRKHAQEDLSNLYGAANRADQGEDGRLAKYMNYYRQVGL